MNDSIRFGFISILIIYEGHKHKGSFSITFKFSKATLKFIPSILEMTLDVETYFEVIWSISSEITHIQTFELLMLNCF